MFPGNIDQGWFPRSWRRAPRRVRFVESQFGAGACKWLVAFSFSANLEFCTIPTSPEISPSLRAGMRIRLGGSPFYHCKFVWKFEIEKLNGPLSIIVILKCCSSKLVLSLKTSDEETWIVGKKVEVSLRLFDIFEINRVFIFLLESWRTHPADCGLWWNL